MEIEEVNLAEELLKAKEETASAIAKAEEAEKKRKQAESALVNFRTPEPEVVLEKASVYAKRFQDTKKEMTNREYIENSLKYRSAALAETGRDVFGDNGEQSADTIEVANVFSKLLEENPKESDFNHKFTEALRDDPKLAQLMRSRAKN